MGFYASWQEHEQRFAQEDPEGYAEYWSDTCEHTCQGCRRRFKAPAHRGDLAYCDPCADRIEQGMEVGEY